MTTEQLKNKLSKLEFTPSYSVFMHKLGVQRAVVYAELLGKAMYLSNKNQLTGDGYFFYTAKALEYKTGIPRRTQYDMLKDLERRGLIVIKQGGDPKKRYIKVIMDDAVINALIADTREPNPEQDSECQSNTSKSNKCVRANVLIEKDDKRDSEPTYGKQKTDNIAASENKQSEQSFDMSILKKQINKLSRAMGPESKRLSQGLYSLYQGLFDRVGYPCSGLSNKSVGGCLKHLQGLDKQFDVIDMSDEYLDEYEKIHVKEGHTLGMNNLMTENMLDILMTRMTVPIESAIAV